MKRSSKSTHSDNLNLSIVQQLKSGLRPSQICKVLNINKTALQYHLSSLKAQGIIRKVGYGVWEVQDQKEVQKSTRVGMARPVADLNLLKQDSVRGHGFVFKFELPKNLRNWNKREDILKSINIDFTPLRIFGGGQKILFKGRNIWLTSKSIIIYEQESFIADLASESQSKALSHFFNLLTSLERTLRANFNINKSRFRVSRQHYALIKNALARQYNDEGKKLECYTGEGLWFLIDNSFNLNEAETVHPKTAVQDNKKVQEFFNGLKQLEGFTPQFVTNSLGQTMQTQLHLDHNLKTHFAVLEKISNAVDKLTDAVKELKK